MPKPVFYSDKETSILSNALEDLDKAFYSDVKVNKKRKKDFFEATALRLKELYPKLYQPKNHPTSKLFWDQMALEGYSQLVCSTKPDTTLSIKRNCDRFMEFYGENLTPIPTGTTVTAKNTIFND